MSGCNCLQRMRHLVHGVDAHGSTLQLQCAPLPRLHVRRRGAPAPLKSLLVCLLAPRPPQRAQRRECCCHAPRSPGQSQTRRRSPLRAGSSDAFWWLHVPCPGTLPCLQHHVRKSQRSATTSIPHCCEKSSNPSAPDGFAVTTVFCHYANGWQKDCVKACADRAARSNTSRNELNVVWDMVHHNTTHDII